MKRGIAVLVCVSLLTAGVYFAIIKWGIQHETLNLFDASRQRPVSVDVAVRRDYEMKADDGFWKLPVAIISNGNTVKNTEYSFLANVLAAKGYLVASIQQDLPTDPPLMTIPGKPYVGRQGLYQKGEANILFVLGDLKSRYPNADFNHLTLVGHSNGGDTAMYFAMEHPDMVTKVVTLDNLRVPFMTDGRFKIISFRSKDPVFKPDPGVVPDDDICQKAGITVVRTSFQHNDMRDTGSDEAKTTIQGMLDKMLDDDSPLRPVDTTSGAPVMTDAGPVAPYAPVARN